MIVNSLPIKKNSKSSFWVRLIIRRLSFPVTWVLINCKCSPWMASIISALVALVGSIALCINQEKWRIIGVILIQFWLILDCVDGNIARVKKCSSEFGEFVDALSGYYVTGFVFIGIGVAAYHTSWLCEEWRSTFIILGGISAVAGLLSRIIHQKYTYTVMLINHNNISLMKKDTENKQSLQYWRSRIDKELGISGFFMPILIIAAIYHYYDLITLFYFCFQCFALLLITVYYSLKAKK